MKVIAKAFPMSVLITAGIALLGQQHFLLSNLLGILHWPLLLGIGIWAWRYRKSPDTPVRKGLYLIGVLLLVNMVYLHIPRVEWGIQVEDPTEELSLLTYNLFFKNRHPQNILNEIQGTDADLVLVQELTPKWEGHLRQHLGAQYPHQKYYARGDAFGLGILSKYPITNNHILRDKGGQPIFQICELTLTKKRVVLVNTHLASPAVAIEDPPHFFSLYKENYQIREQQWQQLVDFFHDNYQQYPKIVAGDYNTMRTEGLYRNIRYHWRDVYAKTNWGWGANFPNVPQVPFPLFSLDYIMIQGEIEALEAKVLKGSSSDHLAIWGKLAL